ncbi:MAG: DUF4189 domain-containing protein [Phycisphaerales bacterium]|nr:DUF4189 domain-containing protein [Hyphomonadaceae bacterium]
MGKWWIIAALGALVVGGGVLALVLTGVWPGPSEADRQRARLLLVTAEEQNNGGDQDAALQSLTNSIALAPQVEALRLRASIYVARGEFDGAERDLDQLVSGRGRSALAADYSLRCWLRARGDQLDRARDDCDRALEIDPALASAFGNRGLVGLRQRWYRDAWEDFNAALQNGGSDEWVAWRVFGRGAAAYGQGRLVEGRQDIETALRTRPAVAVEFAQFGIGADFMREFDDAAFEAATRRPSLITFQQYLYVHPNGEHVGVARSHIETIRARIEDEIAAGRRAIPGFSLAQDRGPGAADSFGAIAISRSGWRVAFATDYGNPSEAQLAAATACGAACDAFAFRNVCAGLALSPSSRARGMAWAYGEDNAVDGAVGECYRNGGRDCAPVHVQCTPTPSREESTPAAVPH